MPNISTTTGEGRAIVDCSYSVDSDGDIEDLKVNYHGLNIIKALTEEQVNDIEAECLATYLEQCKEDAAEAKWERKQERDEYSQGAQA